MTPVESRVRELFASYCERYPNTRWALELEKDGNYFRVMRNWICETYRIEKGIHDNEWRFVRKECTACVQKCVEELVGRKGGDSSMQ